METQKITNKERFEQLNREIEIVTESAINNIVTVENSIIYSVKVNGILIDICAEQQEMIEHLQIQVRELNNKNI